MSYPRAPRLPWSAAVFAAAFSSGAVARAEPGVSLALRPAPAGDHGLLVGEGDARGDGVLRARLLVEHAEEPLVLITPAQSSHRVVERQLWLHVGASYALAHRVLFSGALPVLVASRGGAAPDASAAAEPAEEGAALGDARIGGRVRLLGLPSSSVRLGAGLELALPTGQTRAYAGDGGVGYRAKLALSAGGARSELSAELGYFGREGTRLPSVLPTRVGSAIEAGLGGRVALDPGAALWLGAELASAFTVGEGARLFDPRSTLVHALVTARVRPVARLPLELGAGFGPSLGQAPGSADYRVLAFVAVSPEAPPPDRDGDGVPDATDVCLRLAGARSDDPMMNGCPPVPLDTDGDGVPDAFDACPRVPGEATAERRSHGCRRGEGSAAP